MKFNGNAMRAAIGVIGAALTALALVSCGGGQAVEKFVPTRILAFGDESSFMDANGLKYSVNALKADGTIDCKANPIWVQGLAAAYGLVFPQCNPDAVAAPASQILATVDATSGNVKDQIDLFVTNGGSFGGKDLATVLAGARDILDQYALIKAGTTTEAQAIPILEQAGTALAAQVNRIGLAGGKVLIATVPDMGLTPFAVNAGTTDAALLTRLTSRFNSKLRVGLINDGHMTGLLLVDEAVQSIVKNPGASGYIVVDTAVCAVALPNCTTATLVPNRTNADGSVTIASGDTWLWSDATHFSAGGQKTLGSIALSRAQGNPF